MSRPVFAIPRNSSVTCSFQVYNRGKNQAWVECSFLNPQETQNSVFPSPPPLFPIQAENSWGSELEFCDTSLYPSEHPSSHPNFHPWNWGRCQFKIHEEEVCETELLEEETGGCPTNPQEYSLYAASGLYRPFLEAFSYKLYEEGSVSSLWLRKL